MTSSRFAALLAASSLHAIVALAQDPPPPPASQPADNTIVTGRLGAQYEILSPAADASPFLDRLGGEKQNVWLDGDVLHFAHVAPQGPVQVVGGVQEELARVPGSDLWLLRLRWPHWREGFVAYTFLGPDIMPGGKLEVWRGDGAPSLPRYAEAAARVEHLELDSRALGEKRKVTVILPPGEHRDLPAIVMADGQSAESWGRILRTLIDEGRMRPVALIGIHNGGYRGDHTQPFDPQLDMRAREYLERMDPERFDRHLRWVTDEVLPEVARRFGVSTRREELAVAGFSNGGSFAAAAALRRPDVFGAALPFSVGVLPEGERPDGPLPRFFFAAGELEPSFLKTTRETMEKVRAWGAAAEMQAYSAGHDSIMWDIALTRFAPQVFPPQR